MNIGIFYKQFLGQGGFPREWRRFSMEVANLGEMVRVYSYSGTADTNLHSNVEIKAFQGSASPSFSLPASLRQSIRHDRTWLDGMLIVGTFMPENITLMFWLRRLGIPYVVAPLGHLAPKIIQRGGWKKQPFIRILLMPSLRKAAAIHTFSKIESEWMQKWLQRPLIQAAHGAYLEDIPVHIEEDYLRTQYPFIGQRKIVLFLGRLDIYCKGLDTLIMGFRRAVEQREDIVLLLVGPDQDGNRKKLQELIEQQHLREQVFILGPIYDDIKFSAMAGADLFVYPSNNDILPRSTREALSVGCPILVSEETHFGELVRQYAAGGVCEVTVESIANNLLDLLSNDARLVEMRENALRLVREGLDWSREATKLRDGLKSAFMYRGD